MDDLVENCCSAKIEVVVNKNQIEQDCCGVENIGSDNHDFVILGDFS